MTSEYHSTKSHLVKGLLVLLFGIGGFVFWSLTSKIEGAIVASGQVTVEAKRQAVQHPDGGLVTELHVKEGSSVEAGAPLLTLDGTELNTQQAVLQRKIVETRARIERLFAEIKQAEGIGFSDTLHSMGENIEDMQSILQNERLLFAARRTIMQQTHAQLKAVGMYAKDYFRVDASTQSHQKAAQIDQ
ncbi:biotin/lipoyl-binding protein (plasmid) [Vibrio sp. nBUS_14]|uniref:biotin/lipoyl-binding protein n=1 Tax=Vibrio sp. nBUS_14 TaxID=3395321 RepID=UPI003EBCB3C9